LETLQGAVDLAAKLDAELTVGLFGADIEAAADKLASCGAVRFLGVAGAEFGHSRCSTDAVALEALVRRAEPTLVLAPAGSRMARALPAVAARVGGRIDTRLTAVTAEDGTVRVQRWYYRQRMLATLTRKARPWFLLVESGVFPAWEGASGAAEVEEVAADVGADARRTEILGVEEAASDARTIQPDADLLFVAGAGWTKKQKDGEFHVRHAESLILDFLEKGRASLGSSKSLVDQSGEGQEVMSCMTHLNQVGQTGSTPRHPKGLATCCHGEEPHVVGWRFIGERRAVNLDPNCGWGRGKADVLYVADAFAVMEAVNTLLAERGVSADVG
jgi:electron transfer flavoprotein alpha subunit